MEYILEWRGGAEVPAVSDLIVRGAVLERGMYYLGFRVRWLWLGRGLARNSLAPTMGGDYD